MSTTNSNRSEIINRSSFRSFYSEHKPMKRAQFTNRESGEVFTKLVFPEHRDDKGNYLMLAFSSNLGELTKAELQSQLDHLQVVQLESGSYILCKAGEGQWEDVELEL